MSSSSPVAAPSFADSNANRASASHRAAGFPRSVAIFTARSRCVRIPAASPSAARTIPRHVSSILALTGVGEAAAAAAALSSQAFAWSISPNSRCV
jgi:hypothetical protein